MLGKLTKYEFKATARVFLPFYLAVFGITLINKCFLLLNDKIGSEGIIGTLLSLISALMMIVGIIMIAATLFLTFFMILQRFYKNLFTDEGYLMHTLPVKAGDHIFAKLITSSVWTVVSTLVVILAVFLLIINGETLDLIKTFFSRLPDIIMAFESTMGINFYWALTIFIAMAVISLPCTILIYYLSITLGSVLMPKHKIGGAFLGYLIIYTATQMVSGGLLVAGLVIFGRDLAVLNSPVPPEGFIYFCLGLSTLLSLIMGVISYLMSAHIMQKKLNLD